MQGAALVHVSGNVILIRQFIKPCNVKDSLHFCSRLVEAIEYFRLTCLIRIADFLFFYILAPSLPTQAILAEYDSLPAQARHYKTLHDLYKRPKPNHDAVSQLLDLEFEARRAFVDSDTRQANEDPRSLSMFQRS